MPPNNSANTTQEVYVTPPTSRLSNPINDQEIYDVPRSKSPQAPTEIYDIPASWNKKSITQQQQKQDELYDIPPSSNIRNTTQQQQQQQQQQHEIYDIPSTHDLNRVMADAYKSHKGHRNHNNNLLIQIPTTTMLIMPTFGTKNTQRAHATTRKGMEFIDSLTTPSLYKVYSV